MWYLSNNSKKNREGIHDNLIKMGDLALTICPIDFGYPKDAGKRTTERQFELFHDGKSKCDGRLLRSYHQSGRALDFYAYVDGKASWDKLHLALVGASHLQAASILGFGAEWGGLWTSFKDYPHIQLTGE